MASDDSQNTKIFFTSFQRCGTKSFGKFFRLNGYTVASWPETDKFDWMEEALFQGRLEQLIRSEPFSRYQVFEDGPWFDISVIRYLYWHCPGSRFVYFHRPVDDWFRSMLALYKGAVLRKLKRHCQVYNRLDEYYRAVEAGIGEITLPITGHYEHYKSQFENHAMQIRAFFEDKPPERFFWGDLYDDTKWKKLNTQMGLGLTNLADVHVHATRNPFKDLSPSDPVKPENSAHWLENLHKL